MPPIFSEPQHTTHLTIYPYNIKGITKNSTQLHRTPSTTNTHKESQQRFSIHFVSYVDIIIYLSTHMQTHMNRHIYYYHITEDHHREKSAHSSVSRIRPFFLRIPDNWIKHRSLKRCRKREVLHTLCRCAPNALWSLVSTWNLGLIKSMHLVVKLNGRCYLSKKLPGCSCGDIKVLVSVRLIKMGFKDVENERDR